MFTPQTTFFDYGCGHGADVRRMAERGYASGEWDLFYFPEAEFAADAVNLGYVINIIEDEQERRAALRNARSLAKGRRRC